MARDDSNLYVISIVAIVAVVGLATLFLNGEVSGDRYADTSGDRYGGDLIGHAVSDGQESRQKVLVGDEPTGKSKFTSREDSRARQLEEQKRIKDAIAKK